VANDRRLIALVAIVAASVVLVRARSATAVTYTTVPLARQDLVQTVTATGTVNPQNTIAIGSQASGIISEIDVDFNARVHKGQVLAKLIRHRLPPHFPPRGLH